jgi:lipoate-protein ligase B
VLMETVHHMTERLDKSWLCVELPVMEYREAWDLQSHLVAARRRKAIDRDVVLFMEHPPVFTLGSNCGLNNLTVSDSFLKRSGIPVIRVERGGDITFHGPGQLVVYPIIALRAARLPVASHIEKLEEVMIRTAGDWGVEAERNSANRGVWVGNNKLGSVGIAIRHGISFHGMAFNVNTSLEPFGWINPCGLKGVGITSLEREVSGKIPMDRVRATMRGHMETVFGAKLVMTNLSELQKSTLSE